MSVAVSRRKRRSYGMAVSHTAGWTGRGKAFCSGTSECPWILFVNMNIGDAFGTFVGKELPSVIWNMFACISGERQDNYIAGFSNGGYGCLHTALSYPQKFAGVGAFSAGDKADSDFHHLQSKKQAAVVWWGRFTRKWLRTYPPCGETFDWKCG